MVNITGGRKEERRTLAVDPQQGCRGLGPPLHEETLLEEPRRCSLVLKTRSDIMISGRIRWGQPRSVVLPFLDSCNGVSARRLRAADNHGRLAFSMSFVACSTRTFVSFPSSHMGFRWRL